MIKACAFEGCQRGVRCAGYCGGHYTQSRRGGPLRPLTASKSRARDLRPFAERFWSKVDRSGTAPAHRPELGPCWLWTGGTTHNGYGSLSSVPWRHEAASTRAHRIAWELEHGSPPPVDKLVLHECDNRICCRPSHLFVGEEADNSEDMARKGRTTSPLTETQARAIQSSDEPVAVMAQRYGVGKTTINNIRAGRTWGHLREGASNA